MRRAMAIFLFVAVTARAQHIGQNAPPGGTPGSSGAVTFTSGTQLVVEAVVITDKKGSPVEGLTAKEDDPEENRSAQPEHRPFAIVALHRRKRQHHQQR